MLGHPSSAYRFIVSGRLFCEAGNFEWLFYLVMAKFIICFLLCPAEYLAVSLLKQKPWSIVSSCLASLEVIFLWLPHVQFIHHIINQSRHKQFLVQMTTSATMTANSIRSFFNAHHLWSKLVLSEADMSYCWENTKFLKDFKLFIFC